MRILYISDSAIPSASPNSVHVMKMCQAFTKLGHQVQLWGKNTTACVHSETDVFSFYAVEKSFLLSIFPARAFKGSGTFYNLCLIWRLLFIQADLVYTRSISAAFLLALYRKPFVFEVHEPFEEKGIRLRWMFQLLIKSQYLRKLVVISNSLRNYYESNFQLQPPAILVAHDAADQVSQVESILKDGSFKVGYVGSLLPGKGIEILLPLAELCSDVSFHVVGGSREQIEKVRRTNGPPENVFFHGFKSQSEIPGYIQSFDVLIAPYLNEVKIKEKGKANNLALWMSPLKIFEYMASGKPIVATNLPVICEILEHHVTGLLCDPMSIDSWQRAIYLLKQNEALGKTLAANALRIFEAHHTWQGRADAILKALVA